MTLEENIKAILECNFVIARDEVIESTTKRIMEQIERQNPLENQKTGCWVSIDDEPHEDYECNCCGYIISTWTANIEPHTEYKYCPNCGAKMEGE